MHGAKVALVERERWGGSCPNVACTPTKAYVVAAELVHDVNTLAPRIGVEAGPARADLARVREWKETLKKPQAQVGRGPRGGGLHDLHRRGEPRRAFDRSASASTSSRPSGS